MRKKTGRRGRIRVLRTHETRYRCFICGTTAKSIDICCGVEMRKVEN